MTLPDRDLLEEEIDPGLGTAVWVVWRHVSSNSWRPLVSRQPAPRLNYQYGLFRQSFADGQQVGSAG